MTAADLHARLDAQVDAHHADAVAFLREMVRVPTDTPPGDNARHARTHRELARGDGLRRRAPSGRRSATCARPA